MDSALLIAGVVIAVLSTAKTSATISHFGLGAAPRASTVVVIWPEGLTQTFENVPADRRVLLPYPLNEDALRRQSDNLYSIALPHPEIVYLGLSVIIILILGAFLNSITRK